ncbi:hypothetical protein MCEMSE15_01281 [Fimbriimonadaceae bacterium]
MSDDALQQSASHCRWIHKVLFASLLASGFALMALLGCNKAQGMDFSKCEFSKDAPPGRVANLEDRCAVSRKYGRVAGLLVTINSNTRIGRFRGGGAGVLGAERLHLIKILQKSSHADSWQYPLGADVTIHIQLSDASTHRIPVELATVAQSHGDELANWLKVDLPKYLEEREAKARSVKQSPEQEEAMVNEAISKSKYITGPDGKLIINPNRKP